MTRLPIAIMMALAAIIGISHPTVACADDVESAQEAVDQATSARDDVISRIDQLEGQIDEANAEIPRARERLRKSIISSYKYQQETNRLGLWETVLSCRSFDQMITVVQAQRSIRNMNERALRDLRESYETLNASKQELDDELAQAELTLTEANELLAERKEEEAERERKEAEAEEARRSASSSVSSGTPAYENSGSGLTKWGGVYYYNGHKETYYSSRVLRHYRIGEWHTDSEGFWRTAEGYYVVAANSGEYSEGTLVDTSKGLAQVLDSGCSYGTIDMYVNW